VRELRERLADSNLPPERLTDGMEHEPALAAFAVLLEKPRRAHWWSKDRLTVVLVVLVVAILIGVPWIILSGPLQSSDFALVLFAGVWLVSIGKHQEQAREREVRMQRILVLGLTTLVSQVNETRLVPLVLDVARQVPRGTVTEVHASWDRAEEAFLARLLPRLTIPETQRLSTENVAYLSQRLMRDISEEATVAILLTLASAGELESTEVARIHLESPSPQVREAAREYLQRGGTI
jgi:hypothetical protein